jgi:hypothetical protein
MNGTHIEVAVIDNTFNVYRVRKKIPSAGLKLNRLLIGERPVGDWRGNQIPSQPQTGPCAPYTVCSGSEAETYAVCRKISEGSLLVFILPNLLFETKEAPNVISRCARAHIIE